MALWASAARRIEDIPAAPCGGLFPLTPTPSLRERVNPSLRGVQPRLAGFPLRDARCSLSLRERVRVRGKGANYLSGIGPFPELSNWTNPPASPEDSRNAYERSTNLSLRANLAAQVFLPGGRRFRRERPRRALGRGRQDARDTVASAFRSARQVGHFSVHVRRGQPYRHLRSEGKQMGRQA